MTHWCNNFRWCTFPFNNTKYFLFSFQIGRWNIFGCPELVCYAKNVDFWFWNFRGLCEVANGAMTLKISTLSISNDEYLKSKHIFFLLNTNSEPKPSRDELFRFSIVFLNYFHRTENEMNGENKLAIFGMICQFFFSRRSSWMLMAIEWFLSIKTLSMVRCHKNTTNIYPYKRSRMQNVKR